jgi:hypothetical protein
MTDDPRCSTAQSQVASMHQLLQWAGATTIKSIYLVILNSPNRWGTVNENRNFIRELIQTLEVGNQNGVSTCNILFESLNYTYGIFTKQKDWPEIVGDNCDGCCTSSTPLWYPNNSVSIGLPNFVPFGCWTNATIHQTATEIEGPCNGRINVNYRFP